MPRKIKADNKIKGGNGDDQLTGTDGNDLLDGGKGWDTVSYDGDARDFTFTQSSKGWTVEGAGLDRLVNIEELHFDNATLFLDGRNNAPLAVEDGETVGEDDSATQIDLIANDWDFEGDTLTVTQIDTTGTSGTVLLTDPANGIVTYDPAGQFESLALNDTAEDTFTYTLSDGTTTVEQTVTITLTGANDAPVVSAALSGGAGEDDAGFNVDLLAGASDVDDGAVLSIANLQFTGDASGITVNGTSLTVDPSAYNHLALNQDEIITYSYDVEDEHGASVPQTATVTITGANDAPVVSANVTEVTEDEAPQVISLLAGISDPDDGAVLQAFQTEATPYGVEFNGANSTLTVFPTAFNYLAEGEILTLNHDFVVSDQHGSAVNQTATIHITGTNDGPTISGNVSALAGEDDAGFNVDLLAGAGDPDSLDILSVSGLTLDSGDASGITANGDGLDVDPSAYNHLALGQSEVITYSYAIIDGHGGSVPQSATITITGTNTAPVATANIAALTEFGVSVPPVRPGLNLDEQFVLSADPNVTDSDTIPHVTIDAVGDDTVHAYTFTVTADDTPVTIDIDGGTQTGGHFDATVFVYDATGAIVAGADGNNFYDSVNNVWYAIPELGSADLNDPYILKTLDAGTYTVEVMTPPQNAPVPVGATYTLHVSFPGAIMAGQSEAAITGNVITDDDGAGVDSDVDFGAILSVDPLIDIAGTYGTLTLNGDGSYLYQLTSQALGAGAQDSDVFVYTLRDEHGASDTATLSINITGANDETQLAAAIDRTESEDVAPFSVDLLAGVSDADTTDTLTVSNLTVIGGTPYGITLNGTSLDVDTAAFQHLPAGSSETFTYSYIVSDGFSDPVTQTATITITGANDDPVATANVSDVGEDASYGVAAIPGINLDGQFSIASDPNVENSDTVPHVTVSGVGDDSIHAYTFSVTAADTSVTLDIDGAIKVDPNGSFSSLLTLYDSDGVEIAQGEPNFNGDPGSVFLGDVYLQTTLDIGVYTVRIGAYQQSPSFDPIPAGATYDLHVSFDGAILVGEDSASRMPDPLTAWGNVITDDDGAGVDQDVDDLTSLSVDAISDQQGTYGSLTLNSDGSYLYTLDNGSDGVANAVQSLAEGQSVTDIFTYTLRDGTGGSDTADLTITIVGDNDAPTVSGAVSSNLDDSQGVVSVDLLANASDIDALDVLAAINLTVISGDASGITVNGNALDVDTSAYQHLPLGQQETISYQYDVIDGQGGSVGQTATLTISGSNQAPTVASSLFVATNEDAANFTMNLLQAAQDVDDGAFLNVLETNPPPLGMTVIGNTLHIDPSAYGHLAAGDGPLIQYSYAIVDEHGAQTPQIATIRMWGVNDAPTITVALEAEASELSDPFSIDLLQGADDVDAGDVLQITNVVGAGAAGLTLVGTDLHVDPSAYAYLSGSDSVVLPVSFDIIDGNGDSVAQQATIEISANEAPVVSGPIAVAATEDDDAFEIDLLQGASDADVLDDLRVENINGAVAAGLVVSGSTLSVDPVEWNHLADGEEASFNITYDISDGRDGVVGQSLDLTIAGVNDDPIAMGGIGPLSEDGSIYVVDLLDLVQDPDTTDTVTLSNIKVPNLPGVSLLDTVLTIDPSAHNGLSAGQSVTGEISFIAQDGNGGSLEYSAQLKINGQNDAPMIETPVSLDRFTAEDEPSLVLDLVAGVTDPDEDDALSIANMSGLSADGMTLVGTTLTLDPNAYNHLTASDLVELDFSYDVIDGNGGSLARAGTIQVEGANDAPTTDTVSASTFDIEPVTASFAADDFDQDDDITTLTYNIVAQPLKGTVTDHGDGTFTYDAAGSLDYLVAGQVYPVTFTYQAIDRHGAESEVSTVEVDVYGSTVAQLQLTVGPTADTKVDGEFLISQYPGNFAPDTEVASLSDGGFVVTWATQRPDGLGSSIVFQQYDASGQAIGGQTEVAANYDTEGYRDPTITGLMDGGFLIAFMDNEPIPNTNLFTQQYAIKGAQFDETGEFVNLTYFDHKIDAGNGSYGTKSTPVVTETTDGKWVTAWSQLSVLPNTYGENMGGGIDEPPDYFFRSQVQLEINEPTSNTDFYDDTGIVGDAFHDDSYTLLANDPAIASLTGDRFAYVWVQNDGALTESDGNIRIEVRDSAGNLLSVPIGVNEFTEGQQIQPDVIGLSDGGFVVAWASQGQDGGGASSYGVVCQIYDSAGNKVPGQFLANFDYVADSQSGPSLAALEGGDFVVTWHSIHQDGSGWGIFGQRLNWSNDTLSAVGSQFRINTETTGDQLGPEVVALEDGGFVVTWASIDPATGQYEVRGQRFDDLGNEDTIHYLNIDVTLTATPGPQQVSVLIEGVPAGARLSAGIDNGDGSWTVSDTDLSGLFLMPPLHDSSNIELTITATVTEIATGASRSTVQQATLQFEAAADMPTLSLDRLDFDAMLTDQDGSETLSIEFSGLTSGFGLSAGTDNGGGVWTLTQAELSGLSIISPASYVGDLFLDVTATSTETSNNDSLSISKSLHLYYDNANGTILAYSDIPDHGDAVLVGTAQDDFLSSRLGNDLLIGGDGNDDLHGGYVAPSFYDRQDQDTLIGGSGDDTLQGGFGDDELTGGQGADTFVYDGFVAVGVVLEGHDVITDFETGTDVLDMDALFDNVGFADGQGAREAALSVQDTGSDTVVTVSGQGNFSVTLEGVSSIDVATLMGSIDVDDSGVA